VLVQRGVIAGVEALEQWLSDELRRGAVALEAASLSALQSALPLHQGGGADLSAAAELDGWLLAQREAAEVRAQQRQMGQSLVQLLADLGWPLGPGAASLAWPAAFAWASLCLEIGSPAMEEAYLYSWVANQISAAVRLVPLGPTQGQRLQLALAALIAERAQDLAQRDPQQLQNGGVGAGLAQLQHAELYSRLFRS
jgi:urease accessory protein